MLYDKLMNAAAEQGHPDAIMFSGNLKGAGKADDFKKTLRGGMSGILGD